MLALEYNHGKETEGKEKVKAKVEEQFTPNTPITPIDYGLPKNFTEFRPGQQEVIDELRESPKPLTMLSAPVGSGKSLIGVAAGFGKRTIYLCTTKQLQDQLQHDFPNAVVLKGRSNYPCLKDPKNLTAEQCTRSVMERSCKKCGYKYKGECPGHKNHSYGGPCACEEHCEYVQTKKRALGADLVILNTHLFMTEANMVGGFSGWPFMVIDEGDLLESALLSYIELTITKHQLDMLDLKMPRYKSREDSWVYWMKEEAIPKCRDLIDYLQEEYSPSNLKLKTDVSRLLNKLKFASREIPSGNWVFIPGDYKWQFKPVFVRKYAERYLWQHCNHALAMSATLVNPGQMCRDLGFDTRNVDLFELPSSFPIESRLIHYKPKGHVTYKTYDEEFPKVIKGLDEVLDAHPDEKVLVHAVSYKNMNGILRLSHNTDRMVTHVNAAGRNDALEQFRYADFPAVLVSPSMDRGVDLPYDACRVVVIVKVPYASLKDKQVAARVYSAKDGGEWYATNTIRSIVQATGRATRAADDYSKTYILDGQFGRIWEEYGRAFPTWWQEALVINGNGDSDSDSIF